VNELPKKGDLIAGKYTVEGVLGQGGMGAVFEVCHRLTGKHFAIKWLLPTLTGHSDAVRRFMREAQVAGRVDHPNVVEVYDVGQDGNSFYMVMELLQGEPLSRRLDRVRRLGLDETCRVLIPVMHGLHVAHNAGVIHRDLKPDNIYLCRTPLGTEIPKVLDFGISKMTSLAGEVSAGVTKFGLVIGTPQYMSPEQLHGEAVDLRTDIYALGVILYEMLGGQVPYPGASFADLVLSVANEDPTPLGQLAPGLPPAILELVDRAMSRDPNQRYSSVEQMGRALAALSSGIEFAADTGDPSRTSMSQRPPSGSRSRTPLATEFEHVRPLSAAELGKPPTVPMLAGVGVAAVAVIALGTAAWLLLKPPASTSAPHVVAQPTIADQLSQPSGAATQPGATHPSDPAVNQNVLNPILPGNSGTELPVPNTVRIGVEAQGGDPSDPRWQNLNPDRNAVGVVDPAGLNAEPNDPAQRIRLGSGRASHSQFGSGVSSRERDRSSSGRSRSPRSESRREREENDATEASGGRQENTRFRATHGQGMNADEF
jgi:serine/threonine protein kinase